MLAFHSQRKRGQDKSYGESIIHSPQYGSFPLVNLIRRYGDRGVQRVENRMPEHHLMYPVSEWLEKWNGSFELWKLVASLDFIA
jgi:hypothetical protein